MNEARGEMLQRLPSMTELLARAQGEEWSRRISRERLSVALRTAVERARQRVLDGSATAAPTAEEIVADAQAALARSMAANIRPVINATGIVLHTGLGRAPLAPEAVDALLQIAGGYCNVELELASGERGRRTAIVAELLRELTGAEAATAVNNNAAATMLVLNTLSEGREAVVSRGQLIEIGGSFRLPDVMNKSGAVLREVGTTNRTRASDYAEAIGERTGVLVLVHTSNYRVVGFVEEAPLAEVVALGRARGVPVFHDLGSGALLDLGEFGMGGEPVVRDSLEAGADVVAFSGDKLLGGPQCGIVAGRAEIIARVERNPLMRAFRLDKLTLAALEATLRLHRDGPRATEQVPALRMLTEPAESVRARAERLAEALRQVRPGDIVELAPEETYAGGGSLPTVRIATWTVCWRPVGGSAEATAAALRRAEPPVIARRHDDAVIFDCRTIGEEEWPVVVEAVRRIGQEGQGS